MAIDWIAVGAMLQGIGTLGGVGAVIWGASYGANAWRDQKRAERRLEVAERILTATHKARSALENVRSPMMWAQEQDAAEDELKLDKDWLSQGEARRKRLIMAQAYFNRLKYCKDERAALDDCLPMSRAMFSEELELAVKKLRHQFWVVHVDVQAYVEDEHGTDPAFTTSIRRSMYDVKPTGETNPVSDAIAESVSTIERVCMPALRLDGT